MILHVRLVQVLNNNMASIQTFIGNHIAVQRKKKRTYAVLEWSAGGSLWRPSHALTEGSVYMYGTSGLASAPVKICIGSKNVSCKADGDYLKSGNHIIPIVYKHSGADNFPQSFYAHEFARPTATITEVLPRPLWLLYTSAAAEADPSLAGWLNRLAPIPAPAPAPAPGPVVAGPAPAPAPGARNGTSVAANWPALPRVGRVAPVVAAVVAPRNIILPEKIPQRIAWIVAEDACKRGEDCSITLDAITPITAAVTSCFHVFDANAIAKWLETTPGSQCPMCKKPAVATVCFTE